MGYVELSAQPERQNDTGKVSLMPGMSREIYYVANYKKVVTLH